MDVTDTMLFITQDQVHRDQIKDMTYDCILVDYQPQKEKPHITQLTEGKNLFFYAGYVSTTTS